MSPRILTPAQLLRACQEWNRAYPVGTPVRYYKRISPREDPVGIYRTRSEAVILGGHTAVIWLDGKSGCVALDACEPVSEQEAEAAS